MLVVYNTYIFKDKSFDTKLTEYDYLYQNYGKLKCVFITIWGFDGLSLISIQIWSLQFVT